MTGAMSLQVLSVLEYKKMSSFQRLGIHTNPLSRSALIRYSALFLHCEEVWGKYGL